MTRSYFLLSTLILLLSVFALRAQERTEIWQMPTAKLSTITNIDSDEQGNTYYVAMFAGDMNLSGNQLSANPSAYVVFARDREDEIIWTKLLPFTVKDIAASDAGVWILGQSRKPYTLGDKSPKTYSKPVVVLLLNTEGGIEYIAEGGSEDYPAYATAIDYRNEELSFMVSFEKKFNFEGRSIFADMQKNYAIIQFDKNKSLSGYQLLTGGNTFITGIWPNDLTYDTEGNLWVVGEMSGEVKIGDINYTTGKTNFEAGESLYNSESFLLKINQDGQPESIKKIVTEANCEHIISLQDCTLLISGYFKGNIQGDQKAVSYFGDKEITGSLNNSGDVTEDGFAAKFDRNGSCIWITRGKGGSSNRISEACEDMDGNIYLSGFAMYDFGFEGTSGSCPIEAVTGNEEERYNFNDAFIIKLTSDGSFEYIKRGGGNKSDNLKCIHYSNGKVRAGGSFTAAITFDGQQVNMRSTYYSGTEIRVY